MKLFSETGYGRSECRNRNTMSEILTNELQNIIRVHLSSEIGSLPHRLDQNLAKSEKSGKSGKLNLGDLTNFRQILGSSRGFRVIMRPRQVFQMVSGVSTDTYLITEKNPNKKYYFIMEKKHFQKNIKISKNQNFRENNLKMLILNENSK